MEKFIEFNGGVFNTRYIIAVIKGKQDVPRHLPPQYVISMHTTGDVVSQYFNEEYERDVVFNKLSRDLLNE